MAQGARRTMHDAGRTTNGELLNKFFLYQENLILMRYITLFLLHRGSPMLPGDAARHICTAFFIEKDFHRLLLYLQSEVYQS